MPRMSGTPRPYDSDDLRASIERLSKQSDDLRKMSEKNSEEAIRISKRIQALKRMMAAAERQEIKHNQ